MNKPQFDLNMRDAIAELDTIVRDSKLGNFLLKMSLQNIKRGMEIAELRAIR